MSKFRTCTYGCCKINTPWSLLDTNRVQVMREKVNALKV